MVQLVKSGVPALFLTRAAITIANLGCYNTPVGGGREQLPDTPYCFTGLPRPSFEAAEGSIGQCQTP
jgi:hypothetical protein